MMEVHVLASGSDGNCTVIESDGEAIMIDAGISCRRIMSLMDKEGVDKDMIKAILPVVDDMERALLAMSDEDAAKEGVQLIFNKLMNILSQKGLKPIEAKGQKFDENLHEAITQFPAAEEGQKGTVVEVVEKGYYLNDKVLRYAKVVVAV